MHCNTVKNQMNIIGGTSKQIKWYAFVCNLKKKECCFHTLKYYLCIFIYRRSDSFFYAYNLTILFCINIIENQQCYLFNRSYGKLLAHDIMLSFSKHHRPFQSLVN